ncbi:sigma-70 family RNA polymerase sigma factor [Demequina flava]|uniref:sigma-70 family RNA polymerase sigma factor n=1 Tax=Demequina flava TaxID=1095025 RepID=UPI0009E35A14|nr:sigma-70 family RNA polymerase sigma factor [Demequina flava]
MSPDAIAMWTETSSDPELIAGVRAGDPGAFGVLYERHVDAARKVATQYTNSHSDVDDVVSESFSRVLRALQRGDGPDLAFRAYLFTIVRRTGMDVINKGIRTKPRDDMSPYESAMGYEASSDEPALEGFEHSMVSEAYTSLPERWQAVLWYTEVEKKSPKDIAPLLGLSANGVAALAYRAREALRQAYLQQHLNTSEEVSCMEANSQLGAYVRGGLAKREHAKIDGHVQNCARCTALVIELQDVNRGMRAIIAPLVLGTLGIGALQGGMPIGGALGPGAATGGAGSAGGAAGGSGAAAGGAGAAGAGGAGGGLLSGLGAGALGTIAQFALPAAAVVGTATLVVGGITLVSNFSENGSADADSAQVRVSEPVQGFGKPPRSEGSGESSGDADGTLALGATDGDGSAAGDPDSSGDTGDGSLDPSNTDLGAVTGGTTLAGGAGGAAAGTGSLGTGPGSSFSSGAGSSGDSDSASGSGGTASGSGSTDGSSTGSGSTGGSSTGSGSSSSGSAGTGGTSPSTPDGSDPGANSPSTVDPAPPTDPTDPVDPTSPDPGTDDGSDSGDTEPDDVTDPPDVTDPVIDPVAPAGSLRIGRSSLQVLEVSSDDPSIDMNVSNASDIAIPDVTASITLPDGLTFALPGGIGGSAAAPADALARFTAAHSDAEFSVSGWDCGLSADSSVLTCELVELGGGGMAELGLNIDVVADSLADDAVTNFEVNAGDLHDSYALPTTLQTTDDDLTDGYEDQGGLAVAQFGAPLLGCDASESRCGDIMGSGLNPDSVLNTPTDNNAVSMVALVEEDGQRNGGTTQVSLPDGAVVTHALLEWSANRSARFFGSDEWDGEPSSASLRVPGTDFASVTDVDLETFSEGNREYYLARADITELVKSAGAGAYSLQDIATAASRNDWDPTYYGGFTLTVVYEDPAVDEGTSVKLLHGPHWVSSNAPATRVFATENDATVTLSWTAFETDLANRGDSAQVNGTKVAPMRGDTVGNANNAGDSFANGSAFANSLGTDAKPFAPVQVGPGQHNITVSTNGDNFFVGTFAVTVAPE